jgi:hypothetical protein
MSGIVEIWEADPMSISGCACNQVRISHAQAERIVGEKNERNEIVMQLKATFGDIKFERDVIHPQRPRSSYPDHVRELIDLGVRPPLFFLDKDLITQGKFPSFLELKKCIEEALAGSKTI